MCPQLKRCVGCTFVWKHSNKWGIVKESIKRVTVAMRNKKLSGM
jgi:hypothetical protein